MTPERHQRIRDMLRARQPDLTVCMEQVHKHHNLAAVARTCDATGVHNVHAIWAEDIQKKMTPGTKAGSGSQNWLNIKYHANIGEAISAIRQVPQTQVLVTHLSPTAVDYRDIDYTRPTAIVLGQELDGASDEVLSLCDQHITIPMIGMVQSLNVSVANAVILYEAMRQRTAAGMYDECKLDEAEQQRILFEGGYPTFARLCKLKNLPYPFVDDEGQIQAEQDWFDQMRHTEDYPRRFAVMDD